eukprot:5827168-Amphidinium_carterae.2
MPHHVHAKYGVTTPRPSRMPPTSRGRSDKPQLWKIRITHPGDLLTPHELTFSNNNTRSLIKTHDAQVAVVLECTSHAVVAEAPSLLAALVEAESMWHAVATNVMMEEAVAVGSTVVALTFAAVVVAVVDAKDALLV